MSANWPDGRCLRGHDVTDPANVYHRPRGERACRVCRRDTENARNAERRGTRNAGPTPNSVIDPDDYSIPTSDVSLLEKQRHPEPPNGAVQYLEAAFDAAYAQLLRRQVTQS